MQVSGEFLVPLVTLAEYFNVKPVLDRCVALAGSMSSVPKLDKLRIAFRTGSTALEVSSFELYFRKVETGALGEGRRLSHEG
jgi:hypothetical protein